MATDIPVTPEPSRRLAPAARWVWRVRWAAASVAGLIAAAGAGAGAGDTVRLVLWGAAIASLLVGTPVVPALRYRRWRWDVREHEVDIRRGTLRVRRTLVPMPRVQHVETTQGLLERSLGLASVEVHTAAGGHTIPLLTSADAARVRDRIAGLARMEGG
jgi:uncharacterized protein